MSKSLVLSVLLIVAATGLTWAQFWKSYSDEERQKVAESYWLAGKQYESVGKAEKGREFTALAKIIDPSLDPSTIQNQAMPSAAELLAQGRTTTIGGGAVPVGSLDSFFLRFAAALSEGDAASAATFLDGSIYLSKVPEEVTRDQAQSQLEALFKQTPMTGVQPSSLYDLATATVTPGSAAMVKAWGDTYTYSVKAVADYSQSIAFWEPTQKFYIHKAGGDWLILGEGPTPPPLSWSPQKAPAAQSAPPSEPADAVAREAIVTAFKDCLTAILDKNADGGLAHMSDPVHFLRLNQTVTRDELKTTMEGYFEKPGFGGAQLSDVLDENSIFVVPAASPVEGVTGTVYVLNVKATADMSGSIPFWSDYQKYYFHQEGSDWLIFAIL